ncbi:MAG: hypothetical protein CMJ20_01315 [Phycisphaeraceae bacterium]|nr:hypothetical protein [Phycisphaeraceae bacterium]|tara:strand:- start:45 stop:371 length:327 start_codon:yes stop_codon:yes gene_type:complete
MNASNTHAVRDGRSIRPTSIANVAGPPLRQARGATINALAALENQLHGRLSAYDEPVSDWIVAMKFPGDWTWSPWFGRKLAEQIDTRDFSKPHNYLPGPYAYFTTRTP